MTVVTVLGPQMDALSYWIHEREAILRRRNRGEAKPWTSDLILQKYKFCNVHREDDRVTVWIKEHWREPYEGHINMWIAMCLARMLNWPPTLEEVGFPEVWDPIRILPILQAIKARGDKVWTGAYMVTTSGEKIDKDIGVLKILNRIWTEGRRPLLGDSLEVAWRGLQVKGFGPFLAGQVVADLKYTHVLADAPDWKTWAAIGPGSMRGLNRLFGRYLWAVINQEVAIEEMRFTKGLLDKETSLVADMHLQDFQNCLCEFDKFQRIKEGGKVR